jgi:signal transduction histidine kinase
MIANARWVHEEIPVRLAHRLRDFHRLPYMMMSCKSLAHVHDTYLTSFERLSSFPRVETDEQAMAFCEELLQNVREHRDVVDRLKHSVAELRGFKDLHDQMTRLLDRTFVSRIGNRVIAQHFLAWSGTGEAALEGVVENTRLARVVADVAADVRQLVTQAYGICPDIRVEGQLETAIPLIPEHIENIVHEILKNAVRATVEHHSGPNFPVVNVGIFQGKFDVLIKVSDRGGGFDKKTARRVWDYGFTTANKDLLLANNDPFKNTSLAEPDPEAKAKFAVAGFGVGLPLARLYARYFGGDVMLTQMYGHGADVLINLNRLGDQAELDIEDGEDF